MADSDPEAVTYNSNPEWESRQDVIYHYLAYHFFDANETTGATTIELVNLTDADKDYFNRVAVITRGLNIEDRLFTYLTSPSKYILNHHFPSQDLDSASTNTHRRRFIHHVRAYNLSQPDARARFYIIGLTVDDIYYLFGLEPVDAAINFVRGELSLASDGCLRHREVLAADAQTVDRVEARLARFQEKNHQKVQTGSTPDPVNDTSTKISDGKTGDNQKAATDTEIGLLGKLASTLQGLYIDSAENSDKFQAST